MDSKRALRGGSWVHVDRLARSASCRGNGLALRGRYFGFRLIAKLGANRIIRAERGTCLGFRLINTA